MKNIISSAMSDVINGIYKWRVWFALATEDITDQHRRTTLGPVWLLVNYLAFAGTFILIFSHGEGVPFYIAHVAIGLFVWLYLSEMVSQSVSLFVREEPFIKGTTLPISVYVLRLAMQSIIRAAYMFIGCLALVLLSGAPFYASAIWSLFGIAIILLATPATIVVFAMIGAFFPDFKFIIVNLMRLGLFLTPVFWSAQNSEGIRKALSIWNPFAYFLEIVRFPFLSGQFPAHQFGVCATMTVVLWLLALALIGRYRKQIVFVV